MLRFINTGIVRLLGRCVTMMAVAIGLCLTACDDYDDTDLWNTVNDLESRVTALEEWQDQVNSNIAAIQELLNTTDFITSVTEITSDGEVVGYTIEFLESEAITIYNGIQGEAGVDGETPQIGLTQGSDGNWYWTLNGELMTDSNGNPVRANGEDGQDGADGKDGADGQDGKDGADGQDGQDGATGATGATGTSAPTPQIKLGSSITSGTLYGLDGEEQSEADADAWYLSVDGGVTWYRVTGADGADGQDGKDGATGTTGAAGTDGDSFFQSVDSTTSADYVTFTLADGSSFTVAKYKGSLLTFYLDGTELTDLTQTIDVSEGDLTYTVTGSYDVSVRILEGDGWSATAADEKITITGVADEEALLEVTLTENGKVIETYRLTLTQSTFLSGTGTANNPYLISSKNDLEWLAEQSTSTNSYFSGVYFEMTDDIDLENGEVWISTFAGIFDGQDYTIKNLTISQSETDYVGLIGTLNSGGKVQNLKLESVNITGSNRVGGVVGYNYNGTVTACYSTGNVSGSGNFVGGVVGYNYGTVTACYYSNYTGNGIGSGSGDVTKVDGDTTSWNDAVTGMNSALQSKSSEWRYEILTGNTLPTLTKSNE